MLRRLSCRHLHPPHRHTSSRRNHRGRRALARVAALCSHQITSGAYHPTPRTRLCLPLRSSCPPLVRRLRHSLTTSSNRHCHSTATARRLLHRRLHSEGAILRAYCRPSIYRAQSQRHRPMSVCVWLRLFRREGWANSRAHSRRQMLIRGALWQRAIDLASTTFGACMRNARQ